MQPTRSYFVILSALCLATIALAGDPPKPNPPTSYSVSLFTFSRNGYEATRTYYNQTTKRYFFRDRVLLSINSSAALELIRSTKISTPWASSLAFGHMYVIFLVYCELIKDFQKRGYMYNSTTGQCQVIALTSPWANTWDNLNNATFGGVETTYKGEKCVMWVTALGKLTSTVAFINTMLIYYRQQ